MNMHSTQQNTPDQISQTQASFPQVQQPNPHLTPNAHANPPLTSATSLMAAALSDIRCV